MPVRAVAFDLDDTLAVTDRDRERLLRDAAERAGVRVAFDREDYVQAHREHSGSTTRRPVFEALASDIEADDADDDGADDDDDGADDDSGTTATDEDTSEAADQRGVTPGTESRVETDPAGGTGATDAARGIGATDATDATDVADMTAETDAGNATTAGDATSASDRAGAAALARAYREAVGESLAPVAGAETVVAGLRGPYRVGLLTDGPEQAQRDKLRRLGWTDAFDAVVVTGGIHAPKPDPVAFHVIAAALNAAPAETVYVGDNPSRDIAGAAAAGMLPLQVVYDGGPDPHPAAAATIRRTDLMSLPGVLEDLVRDGPEEP